MNPVVVSSVAGVINYLYNDQIKTYALLNAQSIRIKSPDITLGDFDTPYLKGRRVAKDEYVLEALPFEASERCWNGPDIISDSIDDGSLQMSLWHDLGFFYSDSIAEQLNMPVKDVLEQFNIILAIVWKHYGGKQWKIRIAYTVCQLARSWYHPLKKFLGKLKFWVLLGTLITLPMLGCSCYSMPEGEVVEATEFDTSDYELVKE